jgi:multidrug efflux pump subunit AcrB
MSGVNVMQKQVQISLIAVVAVAALLIAATTFTPAAFAHHYKHKHHHHSSVSIHQSIYQSQSCSEANCQQNAANVAQVGHDNTATVTQANFH